MDARGGLRPRMMPGGARGAFGRIFLYLSAALLAVAGALAIQTLFFLRGAEAAEGTVTGYEVVENGAPFVGGGSGLYYPLVRFRTLNGDRIEFQAHRGTHSHPYEVGGRVIVLYDPDNPESRRLDNTWGLWGGSLVFVIVSGVFALVGVAVPFSFMSGPKPYEEPGMWERSEESSEDPALTTDDSDDVDDEPRVFND